MFAIEKKYGIIRKEHPAHAKADFLSALRTLTEEEQIELWKELEQNGIIKRKVLIASDGEKTFVLVNGTPLIGDKIDFKSDMCGVRLSVSNALLTPNLYKASDFAAFVKNKLGYDLSVM